MIAFLYRYLYDFAGHRGDDFIVLAGIVAFFHTQIFCLSIDNIYPVRTVENIHIVAFLAFFLNEFCIVGITLVQNRATAVFGHDDIDFIRFPVDGKLHFIAFFVDQRNVGHPVSYMYFHYYFLLDT